jgi:two-component system cell cycle sensor histidine kinase/response regulator CckA
MTSGKPTADRKTILLVDDEQAVRSIVLRILRRADYEVVEAEDGAAAIRIAESHPGAIDLVVTDMFMPGMMGPEMVRKLMVMRPGIRALFMSGYADKDSTSGVPLGANFLGKPFSSAELGQAVEKALAGPPVS